MKTTYKQRRMIWRMTIARPIKKSRIKRKLKIDATAAFFATHEILAMCSIDTSRGVTPGGACANVTKKKKIGRSVPKSKEAPRTAATLSKMRDIDFVLRGTTYIASSLVLGMIYLSSVIGFTYCMPPAISIGVYKIII